MGKDAQFDGETMVEVWRSPAPPPPPSLVSPDAASLMLEQSSDTLSSPTSVLGDITINKVEWEGVGGLESLQLQALKKVASQGVLWKHPTEAKSLVFTLHHGGDVEADGNCLFTASQRAMRLRESPLEVRLRTVKRFLIEYEACIVDQQIINDMISHLYAPDVTTGWGVHVVQDVKLLARKADREALDASIEELVQVGVSRDSAAESIMKDHCIPVADGESWAKYMSLSGSYNDEYDIITLQYTEEGLLGVDENREGRAAAFGDDIAIQCLASEYEREIFVVQAHGTDAMVDSSNCLFFLPHRPSQQVQVCHPPVFLFMKGTGWCSAGADHYEPIMAYSASHLPQETAAFVL
ncbi:unnamed protein product [Sphagnum troendelagicum]|uniref:OTU domain-containing protein n=1 Tax=Sphagnum troendelagicum TaxID=128251 RepID=A0ABP0UQX5_9BRYO